MGISTCNITKAIAELPSDIYYDGITFTLKIQSENRISESSIAVCYSITHIPDDPNTIAKYNCFGNSWLNPFSNGDMQGFLYLCEFITDDEELVMVLRELKDWLIINQLLSLTNGEES